MIEKILKRSLLIVSVVLGVMSLLTGIAGGFTPEIVNAIQNTPPVITAGWTVVNYELGVSAPSVFNTSIAVSNATAFDAEDGDITAQITAAGVSSVNITVPGTYYITLSVVDSGALTDTLVREINVRNQGDAAPGRCYENGNLSDIYTKCPPDITLLGDNPMTIEKNSVFTDPGATALDFEDGDITNNITATGTVNTANTGAYTIRYNVRDSQNLAAVEKVRTIVVKAQSGCGSNCGGGVYIPPAAILTIFDEKIEVKSETSALITWKTDNSANSRVVYGTTSKSGAFVGYANYGYTDSTLTDDSLILSHSMLITGLKPLTNYYFKPVSDNSSVEPALGKELALITGQPPVIPPVIPPVVPPVITECNYLLEYLRIDLPNNPLEVIKLQSFLRNNEGFSNLAVNGVFDQATLDAVNIFQMRYGVDVLIPWGYTSNQPTGYVYITTKKKVNELYCQRPFPLTFAQEQEIDSSRTLYESMSQQGVPAPTTTLPIIGQVEPGNGGEAIAGEPAEPIAVVQPEANQPEVEQPVINSDLGIANITDISNIGENTAENQDSEQEKTGIFSASIFSALPSAKAFLILDLSLVVILVVLALFFVYLRRKRRQESEILIKGPNSSLLKNLPGIENSALNLD